jgi:hypothetical protein
MDVYILTNQKPDWSAPTGAPISVHLTLDGAKNAFSGGKYFDKWRTKDNVRWSGPDGFGSIIKMELQD